MNSATLELPIVSAPPAQTSAVKFHLSLNVANLDRSIAFLTALFGRGPAKCRPDYAKFELDEPPLVLSLEPHPSAGLGALNHLGFRLSDSPTLVEWQRRLEMAGISTRREEGVECCYARQTKFWVHDPDGNMWEIYTLEGDLEHRGDGQLPLAAPVSEVDSSAPAESVWAHRLGQPFPARLPILEETVDRVILKGTLNESRPREQQVARLAELRRVLRPGGRVQLHLLTADRSTAGQAIHLPGPAAAVEAVPTEADVLSILEEAGLKPRMTFRGHSPCFRLGECELRESRFEAT